jgi:hypothetical protein
MSQPGFTARWIEVAPNSRPWKGLFPLCVSAPPPSPPTTLLYASPSDGFRPGRSSTGPSACGCIWMLSGSAGHHLMVAVARCRQVQECLQHAVDMNGRRQICAAGHHSQSLDRIVDRNRQVIARRHILPGEHDIPKRSRIRQLPMQRGPSSSSSTQSSGPINGSARARTRRNAQSIPERCLSTRCRESRPRHVPR